MENSTFKCKHKNERLTKVCISPMPHLSWLCLVMDVVGCKQSLGELLGSGDSQRALMKTQRAEGVALVSTEVFFYANKAPGVNTIRQRQTVLVPRLPSLQRLNLCSILQCR